MFKSSTALLLALALGLSVALAQQSDPRQTGNVLGIKPDAPDQYVVQRGDTLWGIAGKLPVGALALARDLAPQQGADQEPASDLPGQRRPARPRHRDAVDRAPRTARAGRATRQGSNSDHPAQGHRAVSGPAARHRARRPRPGTADRGHPGRALQHRCRLARLRGRRGGDEGNALAGVPARRGRSCDPDTNETLAYEAIYLGTARLTRQGAKNEPATVQILSAVQEIE